MYCEKCGGKLEGDKCPNCGNVKIPNNYKPISMWGYFGYEILFNLPIIGFIFALVFALTHDNVNVKNFAKSYFCFLIIAVILIVIIFGVAGGTSLISSSVR